MGGSDDNYNSMLSQAESLTQEYKDKLELEIARLSSPVETLEQTSTSRKSSLSSQAAAFVPSYAYSRRNEGFYDYYGNYCSYDGYNNSYYSVEDSGYYNEN